MLRNRRIPGRPRLVTPRANPMNRPIPKGESFKANRSVLVQNGQGGVSHLPRPGFWRKATCRDIDCPLYLNGWKSILPVADPQGLIHAIRQMGRAGRWTWSEALKGNGMIQFTFPPGLECYLHIANGVGHLVPVEGKDPDYFHRVGARRRQVDYDEFWYTMKEADADREQKVKEG